MPVTASMDRRRVQIDALKAVVDSSNHRRESVAMSSEHVETKSHVDGPENDAQSDDQYVFVECDCSRVGSPSIFSEWSLDGLENDSPAHDKEGLTHTSHTASQGSDEGCTVTSTNADNCPGSSGASSPSPSFREPCIACTPNSLSHMSDALRVRPGSGSHKINHEPPDIYTSLVENVTATAESAGSGVFDSERNALAVGAPYSPGQHAFAQTSDRMSLGRTSQISQFVPIGPPPQSISGPSPQQQRNYSFLVSEWQPKGPKIKSGVDSGCQEGDNVDRSLHRADLTAALVSERRDEDDGAALPSMSGCKIAGTSRNTLNDDDDERVCKFKEFMKVLLGGEKPEHRIFKQQVVGEVVDEYQPSPSILMIPASSCETLARRLTQRCQIRPATMFDPADCMRVSPEEHFKTDTMHRSMPHAPRYVNRWVDREIMLVTDGSCTFTRAAKGHKKPSNCDPSAGASFIYKPSFTDLDGWCPTTMPFQAIHQVRRIDESDSGAWRWCLPVPYHAGKIGLRLEAQGPRGDVQRHTSNRAKLRAVIAALDFRPWHAEGWKRVVIVTDLEYIALGATKWISLWAKRRWRSAPTWTKEGRMRLGKKIANRDLWEELQSRIDILREYDTEVSFWLVPASVNSPLLREAKAAAREAAKLKPDTVVVEEYTKLIGVNV